MMAGPLCVIFNRLTNMLITSNDLTVFSLVQPKINHSQRCQRSRGIKKKSPKTRILLGFTTKNENV